MLGHSLSRLSDDAVRHGLLEAAIQERGTTARVLVYIAEFEERKLFSDGGYSSMQAWCVGKLHYSEDAASRRTRAARVARSFPVIFEMLKDGRLHLTAVTLLAPHLTPENADELLTATMHRSRTEIEMLLATRFPKPDLPTRVTIIPATFASTAPEAQSQPNSVTAGDPGAQQPCASAPARMSFTAPSRIAPRSPERFAVQVTVSKQAYDRLRHAQELLSHRIPTGSLAEVLDAVLELAIVQLERQKFGATRAPRATRGERSTNARHIPLHVKRQVWKRDGGQCTFVADGGHRCTSRWRLEFDHAIPVAQGGGLTVPNVRLRCRAHNQLEARRAFGAEFVKHRIAAQKERAAVRSRGADM